MYICGGFYIYGGFETAAIFKIVRRFYNRRKVYILHSHADADRSTQANQRSSRRESNKYWTVDLKDANGQIIKARLRVNDVFVLLGGKKIILEWNELGQPIRESGGLLGQFLGHVASEFNNFPTSYSKWSKVPASCKDHDKFDVSDELHKKHIMGSLGKKWRDNRSRLFINGQRIHVQPLDISFEHVVHSSISGCTRWILRQISRPRPLGLGCDSSLSKRPTYIPREQWAGFLEYRMNEKTQTNINNRSMQKIPHTLASMSIARKRDQIEMETGRACSRVEMFAISHKKKDGSYVNDEARQKIEELQTQTQLSSEDDAYTTMFGKEHPGRVRSVSQGVCPSQMSRSTSRAGESLSSNYILKSKYDAIMEKMQKKMEENNAEIKSLKNALAYMIQHMGGSLPSIFQISMSELLLIFDCARLDCFSCVVENLGSPAPVQILGDFRGSSSNSHEPQNQASSSQHI
ncbi:hypothetical protein CDL12_19818 [Handroanthus impetiginosus]|uniref:Uncharacterized protein n=1 Tax=Handroanthus impetiginosus TaxID=429701 RepID=A0A2G9GQS3_9LAMI|nr:hypothetical protein CDL12_19818 [Handroanthus impetiginosus]